MRCKKVRDRLVDLLYGDLEAKRALEAEDHLAAYPACREERRRLEAALAISRRMAPAAPSEEVNARLCAAAAQQAPARPPMLRPAFARYAALAAASLLFAAGVAHYLLGPPPGAGRARGPARASLPPGGTTLAPGRLALPVGLESGGGQMQPRLVQRNIEMARQILVIVVNRGHALEKSPSAGPFQLACLREAHDRFVNRDFKDATLMAQSAVLADPESNLAAVAQHLAAAGFQCLGRHDCAAEAASHVLRRYPSYPRTPEVKLLCAESNACLGAAPEALQLCEDLLRRHPDFPRLPDALLLAGDCQARLGDTQSALGLWRRAAASPAYAQLADQRIQSLNSTQPVPVSLPHQ